MFPEGWQEDFSKFRLVGVLGTEVTVTRRRVECGGSTATALGPDEVTVVAVLEGAIELSGGRGVLDAGELVVVDARRHAWSRASPGADVLELVLPRHVLQVARPRPLHRASAQAGQGGLAGVMRASAFALADCLDGSPQEVESLTAAFCYCLRGLVHGEDPEEPDARRERLFTVATDYIEHHLANQQLQPRRVAAHASVSLRLLQQVFAERGESVAGYVRRRRLERCHADLLSADLSSLSIAAIAVRWGFVDPSHFARRFKDEYGCSPVQLRRSLLPAVGAVRGAA